MEKHLTELRRRLKVLFIVFGFFTGLGFYVSDTILSFLQTDLKLQLNAFKAYEVFYTQFTIALLFSLILSMPVIFYHAVKFAKPGLKREEYLIIRNYIPFSFILFAGGAVFSYLFVVGPSLSFFMSMTQQAGVRSVWGLQSTIGLAIRLSFASGLMFQLPVVSMILGKAGILTSEMMEEYWQYFLIGALFIAAVATPPDIITQAMVTLPVMVLYRLSIYLVKKIEAS